MDGEVMRALYFQRALSVAAVMIGTGVPARAQLREGETAPVTAAQPAPTAPTPVQPASPPAAAATAPATATAPAADAKSSPTPVEAGENWAEGYTLPDAPALSLLNADASKIQEPGSLEELGADLVNGFTPQGGLQSGLALKVSGRAFGAGRSFIDYRASYLTRFLARLSLSFATVKDSSTPTTTVGSVGLRLVFWDGSDPLVDHQYLDWVTNAFKKCPTPIDSSGDAEHAACLNGLPKPKAPPWNADGLALAAATSTAFANGELKHGDWADTAIWLTGSLGVDASASFGLQISAAGEYRHADPTHKNIGAGAVRLRGGTSHLRGSLEVSYASDNPSDAKNRKGKLLLGLDFKITKSLWLNANWGGQYNFTGSPFAVFSLAALKYNFSDSAVVAGP